MLGVWACVSSKSRDIVRNQHCLALHPYASFIHFYPIYPCALQQTLNSMAYLTSLGFRPSCLHFTNCGKPRDAPIWNTRWEMTDPTGQIRDMISHCTELSIEKCYNNYIILWIVDSCSESLQVLRLASFEWSSIYNTLRFTSTKFSGLRKLDIKDVRFTALDTLLLSNELAINLEEILLPFDTFPGLFVLPQQPLPSVTSLGIRAPIYFDLGLVANRGNALAHLFPNVRHIAFYHLVKPVTDPYAYTCNMLRWVAGLRFQLRFLSSFALAIQIGWPYRLCEHRRTTIPNELEEMKRLLGAFPVTPQLKELYIIMRSAPERRRTGSSAAAAAEWYKDILAVYRWLPFLPQRILLSSTDALCIIPDASSTSEEVPISYFGKIKKTASMPVLPVLHLVLDTFSLVPLRLVLQQAHKSCLSCCSIL